MAVFSGPYSATWNALSIGNTETGFRLSYNYDGRQIRFDSVGSSVVDILRMGVSMFIDFVMMEYDAEALALMRWPLDDAGVSGNVEPAGVSLWTRAKPLILTGCRIGVNPLSIRFHRTILAPGFNIDIDYSGSRERVVPMRLIVFPIASTYMGSEEDEPELMPYGCSYAEYYEEILW